RGSQTGCAAVAPAVTGGALRNLTSLTGSSAGTTDVLLGRTADSAWSITSSAGGTYADVGTGRTLTFANIENPVGGEAADSFTFSVGGVVPGTVDGGGGFHSLHLSALGSVAVAPARPGPKVGFMGTTAAAANPIGTAFVNFSAITGSSAGTTDSLSGLDRLTFWSVSGTGAGTYMDLLSGAQLAFANFEDLLGGDAIDTFSFQS